MVLAPPAAAAGSVRISVFFFFFFRHTLTSRSKSLFSKKRVRAADVPRRNEQRKTSVVRFSNVPYVLMLTKAINGPGRLSDADVRPHGIAPPTLDSANLFGLFTLKVFKKRVCGFFAFRTRLCEY